MNLNKKTGLILLSCILSVSALLYLTQGKKEDQRQIQQLNQPPVSTPAHTIQDQALSGTSQEVQHKTEIPQDGSQDPVLQAEIDEREIRLKSIDYQIATVKNSSLPETERKNALAKLFTQHAPTKEYFEQYSAERIQKIPTPTIIMDFGGFIGELQEYVEGNAEMQKTFYEQLQACASNLDIIVSSRALCATIYIKDQKIHGDTTSPEDYDLELQKLIKFAL